MDEVYKFGLAGKNIGYSYSPLIYKQLFQRYRCPCVYEIADVDSAFEIIAYLQDPSYVGFNITIPYKREIVTYLDELDPPAEATGVVNTILFDEGKVNGYNTDIAGFRYALKKKWKAQHNRALILGTGATSESVAYVLKQMGIPFLKVGRKKQRDALTYDDLTRDIVKDHRLIVNTTPLGNKNYPGMFPPLPYEAVTDGHYLFDVNYNPSETPFLAFGRRQGAVTQNGLRMLVAQAVESWKIWRRYLSR